MSEVERFSLAVEEAAPETAVRWSETLMRYFPGSRMEIDATDSRNDFHFTTLSGAPFCWVRSDARHIYHRPAPGPASQLVSVLLQLEGRCGMLQGRRQISLRAGQFVFLNMAERMELAEQEGCVQLFVCLPHSGFVPSSLEDACLRSNESEDPMCQPLVSMVQYFWAHRGLMGVREQAHAARALIGLAAMTPSFQERQQSYDVRTQQAMAYIEQHLDDDALSAERVADAQQISRRYLEQLFAKTGFTLSGWLWERRLQRASDALRAPVARRETILAIALAHGFRSAAHFSRKFRQRFGVTPREWRRMGG